MSLVLINQQSKVNLTQELEHMLEKVFQYTLMVEDIDDDAEATLVFVDDNEIRELNYQYREKNCPTDVLSFAILEENDEEPDFEDPIGEMLLGDIVISLERAVVQAEEYGHSFERELAFLTVHGILHLLGYDHETEEEEKLMFARQEEILAHLGITR